MTEAEAVQIFAVFVAAYPQSTADELSAELWINTLARTPHDEAQAAAHEWIGRVAFFPTIADINQIIAVNRRRRSLAEVPAIEPNTVDPPAGIVIARNAYLADCTRTRTAPSPSVLAMFGRGQLWPSTPTTSAANK